MRVVLVRHGQTEMNAHGVYRGRINVSLSARGIEEARAMGRVLEKAQLDLIYSSPLNRAIETAREIASFHPGIAVETAEEFTDMNFGKWQGLSVPEVEMRFPESYRIWVRRPDQADIACGENLRVVRKRALAGLKRIVSLRPEATVVVVSHGVVNKVLLCALLGAPVGAFWHVKQDNGALNLLEYSSLGAKVFLMNYVCHLASIPRRISDMDHSSTPVGPTTDDERQYDT